MPTSAAGNKPRSRSAGRGFTLLELLVVVAIVAIATAGVSLALRDSSQSQLEREAERLAALFESARALARAQGTVLRWRSEAQGFRFEGPGTAALPRLWLDPATIAQSDGPVLLGPEPILPAQNVTLRRADQPALSLRVSSDGLRPFSASAVVERQP